MTQSFTFTCKTLASTQALAAVIGGVIKGGETIELLSDLGGGKTSFTKGLAAGMGVKDVVQSPTFALSQIHLARNGIELHHFDFYRLTEPGVMKAELAESLAQPNAVVVVEWGDIVHDILPASRIAVHFATGGADETRIITITCTQRYIMDALQQYKHGETA